MDLLEKMLVKNGHRVGRIDGSKTITQRNNVVQDFRASAQKIKSTVKQRMTQLLLCQQRLQQNKQNQQQLGFMTPKLIKHIKEYSINDSCDVLLLQIKAASVGLNLQYSSRVYFTSPDFNPSTELQAIARSHRLGQKVPVKVEKLVLQNRLNEQPPDGTTIEERILEIQQNKRDIMARILEDDSLRNNGFINDKLKESQKLTVNDFHYLFGNSG